METKNILVSGVWAFALVWLVGMMWLGGDMLFTLIVFFISIAVSVGAIGLPDHKKTV